MKDKKYWLHADPEEENNNQESPEAKALREKLEQEIMNKITTQFGDTLKGYEDKIKELESKLVDKKPESKQEEDSKKDDDVDLIKVTDPAILKILQGMETQNSLLLSNKKDDLKKKYNLKDEDVQDIKSYEDALSYEKTISVAFERAKGLYLSDEKITEELKKKKKMIVDLDNSLGEEEKKKKHDEITKNIFSIFNKK